MKQKIKIPIENYQYEQVEAIEQIVIENGGQFLKAENGPTVIIIIDECNDGIAYSEAEWEISKEDYEDFETTNADLFIRTKGIL